MSERSTFAIANPRASAGRVARGRRAIESELSRAWGVTELVLSEGPRDITTRVRAALRAGAERVVVVGGDGSINEAVNGFFDTDLETPVSDGATLAIHPVGTGSDFVRSLGEGPGSREVVTVQRVDVGRVAARAPSGETVRRLFVNVSGLGASARVTSCVEEMPKWLGGKVSFYLGTIRGLLASRNLELRVATDRGPLPVARLNSIAVANARFYGGGMMIAPDADLTDGALDVTIVGDISVLTFVRQSGRLYAGTHGALPYVSMLRSRTLEVSCADPSAECPVETDGEPLGRLPVRYDVLPRTLPVEAAWSR